MFKLIYTQKYPHISPQSRAKTPCVSSLKKLQNISNLLVPDEAPLPWLW